MQSLSERETFFKSLEDVERLYVVCKKINRLLRKHKNKLVRGNRLLRWEQKFQNNKIKYFLLFKLPSLGKDRNYIEDRVVKLINLIQDVECFATTYEKSIKYAG